MAVFPPPDAIRSLRHALPSSAPLTRTDKWHVTLVFLGEVAVDAVARLLATVPAPGPFALRLTGGGRFGTVTWAGVDGDLPRLHDLRTAVRDALTAGGFPVDERRFTPHLTVSYRGDADTRTALAGYAGPSWTVTEFTLVRSRDGTYERLASWPT